MKSEGAPTSPDTAKIALDSLVQDNDPDFLRLACQIVSAYVSNNAVAAADLPGMIRSVHAALGELERDRNGLLSNANIPAVPIKKSIGADHLVGLEDGKKLKMLKRYLRAQFSMTPDEYRAKWGLPTDYPMVAPNYAAQRSRLAKEIGLGRKDTPQSRRKK
jgi:predicted transcriptional regulator